MSEWGNWRFPKGAGPVRRQHHAMSYGRQIHDALTRYDANAWCMWEPGNLFDFDESGFKPRMAFHVMGHYSRCIRRGMIRVGVDDRWLRSVAFLAEQSRRISIVTLNDTLVDRVAQYDLGRLPGARITEATLSSFDARMRPLPIGPQQRNVSFTVPRFSVLTLTGTYDAGR